MKRLGILIFSLFIASHIFTQERYQLEEMFYDAQSWYFYEEYEEALPIYLKLNKRYPNKDNINYKIGMCYLNISGEKIKSIPYLEKAVQNITNSYNEDSFTEKMAPLEAYFYLGNAYLINNEIDKALKTYDKFKKLIQKDIYDMSYVDRQIISCNNAKNIENSPINYLAFNLGEKINTKFSEFNPVISGDESTIVFNSSLKFYDAVFWSKKVNGKWTSPINIIPQLAVDDKCYCSSLSYDGKELYLYKVDDFDGNIYVSYFSNERWSNVIRLNDNINTKYWESHASISNDKQRLYFTSNRKGGYGDLDIYVSERDFENIWGMPRNLGNTINTPLNETTPFITENDRMLFFSSEGHYTIGGYDIFYSYKKYQLWSEPMNIGYPLNTTDDNTFFLPVKNGQAAYISNFSEQGYGNMDLYRIKMLSLADLSHIDINGTLTIKDDILYEVENFEISVIDTIKSDTIAILHPNTDNANYSYKTLSGKNHLIFESPKSEKRPTSFLISKGYKIKEIILNPYTGLEEDSIYLAEDTTPILDYLIPDNNNVRVKLSLDEEKNLLIETFVENKLVNSTNMKFQDGIFTYDYRPSEGKGIIKLKHIDENNKVLKKEFTFSNLPENITEADIEKILAEKGFLSNTDKNNITIKLTLKDGELIAETSINSQIHKKESFEFDHNTFSYDFTPAKNILILDIDTLYDLTLEEDSIIFADSILNNQIIRYIAQLSHISDGNLKETLETINIDSMEFQSKEELVDYLINKTDSSTYKPVDLVLPLIASEISHNKKINTLIEELILIADEGLKEALQDIGSNSIEIKNISELITYLNKSSDSYSYRDNDITNLMLIYAINKEKVLSNLTDKLFAVTEGELHKFLQNLNTDLLNISTPYELVNYLLYRAKDNNYTETDVLIAVLKLTTIEKESIDTKQKETKTERKSIPLWSWLLFIILLIVLSWITRKYFLSLRNKKKNKEDIKNSSN